MPGCMAREAGTGSASLEVFRTGWANTVGRVSASTDCAPGVRDGPESFLGSSQVLISVGEALGASMVATSVPSRVL